MWRFTCNCFVIWLIGNLVTRVHAADTIVDQSGALLQASFGQDKNLSVAKALSDADVDVFSTFDMTQDNPGIIHLAGLDIYEESKKLSMKMRQLSNEELRVTSIQGMFDSLRYDERQTDYQQKLLDLSKHIRAKLDGYIRVLRTTKITVENIYQQHTQQPVDHRLDCCKLPPADLRYDKMYHSGVNRNVTCDLLPSSLLYTVFSPGRNLTEVFQLNARYFPTIKWQFFLTADGIHTEYPAHSFTTADCPSVHATRHSDVLLSSAYQWRKNVVIAVDVGNSLSDKQLHITKAVAKHIVFSLSDNDWVSVVAVSSSVSYASAEQCQFDRLMPLSYETKFYLAEFIDSLHREDSTVNHSLAFSVSYNIARNAFRHDTSADVLVAYVSRGLLSSLMEPKQVLTVISNENRQTPHRIVINTYAVIDDKKSVMYERTFLQDIADQNFTKYQVDRSGVSVTKRGRMVSVSSTDNLAAVIGDPFQPFNWTISNKPFVSLPHKDEVDNGVVVTIAWPCLLNDRLFGVAGLEVHMNDILEHITYYQEDSSYAFIMDKRGLAIVHPLFDRPSSVNSQMLFTSVAHFENYAGFTDILQHMLSESSGQARLSVSARNHSSRVGALNDLFLTHDVLHFTYYFQHVSIARNNDTVYVVAIRVLDELASHSRTLSSHAGAPTAASSQLVYHRLDLLPTDSNCMHFKQLATFSSSALFLSAAAFVKPFDHLRQEEVKRMVQTYLAYLSDSTNLISNPGILEQVRRDVWATVSVNSDWVFWAESSPLKSYIVRRYLATPNGLFRVYPGTLLNQAYDPTKRHWYMRAMECPRQVVITTPYLDLGGAGYIVTVSHTVYEGKSASVHGVGDRVVAVVGLDLTMKYFYKLVVSQMPACHSHNVRCFLMDDRGYLITHPDLIEPNNNGPPEEKHITHKEPLIANDILNHRGFVRKKVCSSFGDRTVQRYYQFNTSLSSIITSLVHGEHCSRYQVMPVAGTNAFLGIVKQSCEMNAFCPCSTVDRMCLNCHRVEQTECECPCECLLLADLCTESLNASWQSCARHPEEVRPVLIDASLSDSLPSCFTPDCRQRTSKDECIGVLDCEWCELDHDQVTVLEKPFCATQRDCFGGILGASSPYNDQVHYPAVAVADMSLLNKSMPVGPVAGGIMGCFLLLALGVYCYRCYSRRRSHQCSGSLPGEARLRDSNVDFEDLDDANNGHTNIMLSTFESQATATVNAATVNPYWMNPMYQRPAPTSASDLGYSTMTPHGGDDTSEQASTTCVESSVISRERYRPSVAPASSATILPPPRTPCRRPLLVDDPAEVVTAAGAADTSVTGLSPQSSQTVASEMTALLPHQCLADVQVHSVDVH